MLDRHYNTAERKSFRVATRLYAGRGVRLDLAKILPAGPILLVADQRFTNSDTAQALAPAHTVVCIREPSFADAETALNALPPEQFTAVVALGGGSAIDTAKALHAHLSFGRFDARDIDRPAAAPALVAIPTTAGSGSETSRFFILSDASGVKRSHRAWSYAPDLCVLDPAILQDTPAERLTLGAFDAFLHLWETYVCRNERDPAVDMLALEGISLIAAAMKKLSNGQTLDDDALAGLQRASALGGLAIANVRTGLIHTLAESLAAQVPLQHAETLWVFFETALTSYRRAVEERINRLDRRLRAELGSDKGFDGLIATWRTLFASQGITDRIEQTLESGVDIALLAATASRDTTLTKENPLPLPIETLEKIIASRLSLSAYARPGQVAIQNESLESVGARRDR